MAQSEKLSGIIALGKCEVHYTKKPILFLHYYCLLYIKGNDSSDNEIMSRCRGNF